MINMGRRNSMLRRYARIEKSIEAEVFAQMNKPREQRDEAYIHESLETLSYVRETAQRLEAFHEVEAISYSGSRVRRLAIAATLTVAVLVSVGGIAEALGVRVWNAIINRDLNYFQISYVPSTKYPPSLKPSTPAGESDGGRIKGEATKYPSLEKACEAVGFQPLLPSYLPEGMELNKPVKAYESGLSKRLALEYYSDDHYLEIDVGEIPSGEYVSSYTIPNTEDCVYEAYIINGIEHHINIKETVGVAFWQANEQEFTLQTNLNIDQIKRVIGSFYKNI